MSLDPRNIELDDTRYEGDKRIYIIEGEEYVSVTSKLSETVKKGEGFYHYLANADSYEATQKNMKNRGDVGTAVHDTAEKICNGEKYDISDEPEEVEKRVETFKDWVEDYEPSVIDTEFVVFCKEHNYAGRADLFALIDGERCLIDLKTSKNIYDQHKVQLMMYRYGLEEGGVEVDKIFVLKLGKRDYHFERVEYVPGLVGAHSKIYEWKKG